MPENNQGCAGVGLPASLACLYSLSPISNLDIRGECEWSQRTGQHASVTLSRVAAAFANIPEFSRNIRKSQHIFPSLDEVRMHNSGSLLHHGHRVSLPSVTHSNFQFSKIQHLMNLTPEDPYQRCGSCAPPFSHANS